MSEKGKIVLAYIFGWIGGLIILFGVKNNEKNTKFQAAQAIVLSGGYCIIAIIYSMLPLYIPLFSSALWIFYIVLIILSIVKATNGDESELPVIGNLAKSMFEKKINE